MRVEWRRGIRNYYFILMVAVNILNVLLGYILLTTIDKVEKVTFLNLCESVYTVYTQFGTLLFSSIIIMQFYNDYKEKNVVFYISQKRNAITYFFSKFFVVLSGTIAGTLFSTLLICIPYGELSWIPVLFFKLEAVMVYYSIIMSTIGFLFENFLVGFFINFFAWIIGIVVSDISVGFEMFAYYDASSTDYAKFVEFLDGKKYILKYLTYVGFNYCFNMAVFAVCILLIFILRKRWLKNGI